jgi:hypothetical protein
MKQGQLSPVFVVTLLVLVVPAVAHQPFFEDKEFTVANPGHIKDPTISTAMYATLETPNDVDYYAFFGNNGESILLSITIPQIAGQENFTPIMALMGPELPSIDLPKQVIKPQNSGALILPPPENAKTFFEPFSRTSYWTRQEEYVELPANGGYSVAVWDDSGQVGRYVFVIGDREVLGGDLAFPLKMKDYWTPVNWPISANHQGKADSNQTSGEQGSKKPMVQSDLGIVMSISIMAALAFILINKRIE